MTIQRSAAVLSASLLICSAHVAGRPQDPPAQVIEMTARKYEFSSDEVRVKVGAHVELRVRALDRAHGLKIDPYPDDAKKADGPGLRFVGDQNNVRIEKDQVQVLEFFADRPGRYQFECSVFCGLGHHGMDGWLIVEPPSRPSGSSQRSRVRPR